MIYESISESDPSMSKDVTRSYDTDMPIIQEKRGDQLQQLNDTLLKDNSKLRAQFDEAVKIVQKIDNIHNTNISLSNELRDIKSQKEDLERRLQIALDINEELNSKMANQKAILHEQRQNDIAALQNEIKNSESQTKAINEDFNLKISQIEEEKEKIAIQLKIEQNIITRLVDSASHYFELSFDSPEKVITFLNQPPLTVNEAKTTLQTTESETVKNETIDKTEKKNLKTLKKLNEANQKILSLQTEMEDSEKVRKTVEQSYKKKISALKEKISQINEENQLNDEENKHNILVLTQKVDSLQNLLKKAKEELSKKEKSENSDKKSDKKLFEEEPSKSKQPKNPQIDALNAEIDTLKSKNIELDSLTKKQLKKLNELSEKNSKLEDENDTLKKEYDKAFNDLSALNLIHDSTMKEVETLRSVLHTQKPAASEIGKKKRKIADLKEKVAQLNEELKIIKKKEVDEATKMEEMQINHKGQIDHYKSENDHLHTQIFELTQKVESLSSELAFSKNNRESSVPAQKPPENDVEIPIQIRNFQRNCKKKLETAEKAKEEAIKQKEEQEKQFSDFLVKVSSIVLSKPFLIEDHQELLNSLTEMKNSIDSQKQINVVLSSIVTHMVETFHFTQSIESSVLIPEIDSFYSQFERKRNLLKKRKKLIEGLQKVLSQKVEIIESLEQKVAKFEEMEKQMNDNTRKTDQEMQNLRRLVQSQESQISNFDQIMVKNETSIESRLNDAKIEWKQTESILRTTISELQTKIGEFELKTAELNDANKALKTKIHDYKAKMISFKLKMDEMSGQISIQRSSLESSFANERRQYEETIKKMQQDAEKQRDDIEKIGKELQLSHEKNKKMKCYVKNAQKKESLFQNSINEQKNQLERERQLIIGNAKTQNFLAESKLASKLDERKSRWEKEKRKIFSYVADQFRQFFNPIEVIDEISFKNVISRVRDELIRMQNTDIEIRRLVGADSHQRTEDAVAQIVIGQQEMFY